MEGEAGWSLPTERAFARMRYYNNLSFLAPTEQVDFSRASFSPISWVVDAQ